MDQLPYNSQKDQFDGVPHGGVCSQRVLIGHQVSSGAEVVSGQPRRWQRSPAPPLGTACHS